MAPLSVPFYHEAGATSSLLQYAKLLGSAWRSPRQSVLPFRHPGHPHSLDGAFALI
jgi:hypothetical protein